MRMISFLPHLGIDYFYIGICADSGSIVILGN